MGKGSRVRQQRAGTPARTPAETHEPQVPQNWPDGHVAAEMTDDTQGECIVITIHGVRHFLHATTARELANTVTKTVDEWNEMARKEMAALGLPHQEV